MRKIAMSVATSIPPITVVPMTRRGDRARFLRAFNMICNPGFNRVRDA